MSSPISFRTRGKSRPGRLRLLDTWLCRHARQLLTRQDGPWTEALVVDLGIGAQPWTTFESARAFQRLDPDLQLIGVDIDPQRITTASGIPFPGVRFRQGGFSLPLDASEAVRLIRAMNVLRQYPPRAAEAAHHALGRSLLPGGLLVEGTSSRQGDVLSALLLRRGPLTLHREGLLFATDFSRGFAPRMFTRVLPRGLRAGVHPIPALADFFAAWNQAHTAITARRRTRLDDVFQETAERLGQTLPGIESDVRNQTGGFLVWRPPEGVPPHGSARSDAQEASPRPALGDSDPA